MTASKDERAARITRANDITQKHLDALSDEIDAYVNELTGLTVEEIGYTSLDDNDLDTIIVDVYGMVGIDLHVESEQIVRMSAFILRAAQAREKAKVEAASSKAGLN